MAEPIAGKEDFSADRIEADHFGENLRLSEVGVERKAASLVWHLRPRNGGGVLGKDLRPKAGVKLLTALQGCFDARGPGQLLELFRH